MGTPVESYTDELALQTRIDDYGDIRDVTPPLDEQEENEDSRRREAQARQKLEADGCPPCYPTGLDIFRLQNLPEKCRAIVNYWQSFPGTGDVPLCAQLIAWRKFRAYQQQTRCRFKGFEHKIPQQWQSHGLERDKRLRVELKQQSSLERWIEFQNYQLIRLEEMERERDKLKKELSESHTADDRDAITQLFEYSEQDIKRHMVLVHWIEQKRLAMHEDGNTLTSSNRANGVVRRVPAHVRRKKTSSPILDKGARISKTNSPHKRKLQHQAVARWVQMPTPEPQAAITKNSDDIPRKINIPRKSKPRNETKSNKTGNSKDPSLLHHQLGPQKVTKRQQRSHVPALADRYETITRFGRKSKPPERWVPDWHTYA